jgi:hypothetical protein
MGSSGSVPPGRGVSDGSERHAVSERKACHCTIDMRTGEIMDRETSCAVHGVTEVPVTNSTRRNVERTRRVIR